jgi:DNA-binding transcriptional regulator YiaG
MKDIKAMREKAGLSRKYVCDTLQIPYRTLQNWELGDRNISPLSVYALTTFYNTHK